MAAEFRTMFVMTWLMALAIAGVAMMSVFIQRQNRVTYISKQLLGGAGIISKYVSVIPLSWNPDAGIYNITFMVGTNQVTAAFDTGSAELVVATEQCNTCTGAPYVPTQSPTSVALLDSQSDSQSLCRSVKSYGSQQDTVQVYSDDVSIPRVIATPCSYTPVTVAGQRQPQPIIIKGCPVEGIISNTGSSSLNVFGVCGVQCVSMTPDHQFELPTCQVSESPQFISPIIETFALEAAKTSTVMVMGIAFAPHRDDGAIVTFQPRPMTCERPVAYTPAIKNIPAAPSDLVGTDWRYFVVKVLSATSYNGKTTYTGFPEYLMIDTGTTNFMLPSSVSADDITRQGLVITLADASNAKLSWSNSVEDSIDGSTSMFTNMPDSLSRSFSTDMNVGIMGCLAMRGRYIEFTFGTPRMIGFA